MVVVDGQGLPVGKQLVSASPHEVQLIASTLDDRFAPRQIVRLLYERAAGSNALGQQLHPFPSRDLYQWSGDMDAGYRKFPDIRDLPGVSGGPIRQVYSAQLLGDGRIELSTALMCYTTPMTWVPELTGTIPLTFRFTPDGRIVK